MRGRANTPPVTADIALKVAQASALVLQSKRDKEHHTNRVIIGKDPRLSSYMLEQAMCAGFMSMGMKVTLTGPIPTPAVAMLTRSMHADLGVMISASHNPYQDNGIKLFGPDGYKLDDAVELEIEAAIERDMSADLAVPEALGKAKRLDDVLGRYIEFLKATLPKGMDLSGLKIVVDPANGAAYRAAPLLFRELNADIVSIGVDPDGQNINAGVGATATEALQEEVVRQEADIGIALDGDADRLIVVDEKGQKIDGDQIMAALAVQMKEAGTLVNDTIVATVMSNLGLERFLEGRGIVLERSGVGDRYVLERMRAGGHVIGGEQSGHIILSEYGTTGDGLMAALQVLSILKAKQQPASSVLNLFEPLPQILKNVRYKSGEPLSDSEVQAAIAKAEGTLANDGRLLVRASGTEPLIRVMAEGDDAALIERVVGDVCAVIEKRV